MLPIETVPTSLPSASGERAWPTLTDRARDFITTRLARREPPERIAAGLHALFEIEIDGGQLVACWQARHTPPTQTEHRPDKESVHPADAVPECVLTPPAASPESAPPPLSIAADAPPTRTGPGQEKDAPEPIAAVAPPNAQADMPPTRTGPGPETESHEILPAEVREFIIGRMARRESPGMIAADVRRNFGFEVDHDEIIVCWRDRDALMTQTGPGQEKESRPKLSDEIKEFIVKRIACYETPSRIAAAVRINFGIAIDRRRIFDYNPNSARPPAQRWIDLHDATRARFLREVSEIGVAQKVIRLKMLDRFAEMAEDNHQHDKAAKYLQQAARECGGFYEKHSAPHTAKDAVD
jgi:hypothetical protein